MRTPNISNPASFKRYLTGFSAAALAAVCMMFGTVTARASSPSCANPVTSAPTGPAIVSAAQTPYGKVLVEGSGDYAGCSLYILTSDELHTLTSGAEPFACSDNPNVLGAPCDTVLWPALLTDGTPIAGPGVNPTLLGTVTRTDVLSGMSVQQVTYAGLPLYRFFLDETSGETEGGKLVRPGDQSHGHLVLGRAKSGPRRTG